MAWWSEVPDGEVASASWANDVRLALGSGKNYLGPTYIIFYDSTIAEYVVRDGQTGILVYYDPSASVVISWARAQIDNVVGMNGSICIASDLTFSSAVYLTDDITIFGDNPVRTITQPIDNYCFYLGQDHNTISNLNFVSTVGSPTHAFIEGGSDYNTIINCSFDGHKYGINRNVAGDYWNIKNNTFKDQTHAGILTSIASVDYGTIANNRFRTGFANGAAIHVTAGGHNDLIVGNHFMLSSGKAIWLDSYGTADIHDVSIVSNFIADSALGGLYLDTDGNFVSGNYFVYNNISGVPYSEVIISGNYNTVLSNYIFNYRNLAGTYCVDIQAGATQNNVSYNTLRKRHAAGSYLVDNGTNSNVTGNFEFQA